MQIIGSAAGRIVRGGEGQQIDSGSVHELGEVIVARFGATTGTLGERNRQHREQVIGSSRAPPAILSLNFLCGEAPPQT